MKFTTIVWLSLLACLASAASSDDTQDEPTTARVVAHRGLLLDAPENTLANFRACLELRLGFELDVRRSRDGHLVCVHDETVDRTTDGAGRVRDLTLKQLKALDAGGWFDAGYRGQRVPTLEEVFAVLADHRDASVLIAVDLKGDDAEIERDVVALAERFKVLDRLLFIGRAISVAEVRQRLRRASAESHVACVANNAGEFDAALADRNADWVYVRYVPSPEEAECVHKAGKKLFIAGPTVAGRETENWRTAVEHGVDALLTDYSIELRRALRAWNAADTN
ncbi:MAG: glycerophosphodiester phosphodiesterase family protein [Pirellulaceae bacterium]